MLKKAPYGIHECFDEDIENAYEVLVDNQTIGYVSFTYPSNQKVIWLDFILAVKRGSGHGREIVDTLFKELSIDEIHGTAILELHYFWKNNGAIFDMEVTEDDYDGVFFSLTKKSFYQSER